MCPWSSQTPATVTFCERLVCGWITQPANTWSNLPFIIVGIVIVVLAFRDRVKLLSWLGVIAVLVGVGSFFFHASSTFAGELADLGAMFLFANFAIVCNLRRAAALPWRSFVLLFFILNGISLATMLSWKPFGILIFTVLVTIASLLEIRIARRDFKFFNYKPLMRLIACFATAFFVWVLDITKIVCAPDNHFLQGHAFWHILNSACFFFLYQFYRPYSEKGIL